MTRIDHYHSRTAPRATRIVPAVSAVLHDGAGHLILQRRRDNGLWSLPGGAIEVGETVIEAIQREVLEETGHQATVERLVGIYSDPRHVIEYSDGEVRQQFSICFACRVAGGTLAVSDESFGVESFSFEEARKLPMHPANMIRIADFLRGEPQPIIR